jgi:hypothetical protein
MLERITLASTQLVLQRATGARTVSITEANAGAIQEASHSQ